MLMAYSLKEREMISAPTPMEKDRFTMRYSLSERKFMTGTPARRSSSVKEMAYSLWDRRWVTEDKTCKASLV
jgi:hypothetical protein